LLSPEAQRNRQPEIVKGAQTAGGANGILQRPNTSQHFRPHRETWDALIESIHLSAKAYNSTHLNVQDQVLCKWEGNRWGVISNKENGKPEGGPIFDYTRV